MQYRHLVWTAVCLLLVYTPTAAADPAEAPRIVEIGVVGNSTIPTKSILANVHAEVGSPLNEQQARRDVAALEDMGDFSDVTVDTQDVAGGCRVIYHVLENPTVKGIAVSGNQLATTEKILSLMETRPGHVLNTRTLAGDASVINRYYDNELGFILEPTHIRKLALDSQGILQLDVQEAVTIQHVEIAGVTALSLSQLTACLSEHPGDPFNQSKVKNDAARLATAYEQADYQLDTVHPQFQPDTGSLVYQVVETRIDKIVVEGNTQTREDFILNTLRTRPGTVLRPKVVEKDLDRLRSLGLFQSVRFDPEPGTMAGHVDLVAHIKEAKTGTAAFGVGYGGNSGGTAIGLTGNVSASEKNIGGTGQGVGVQWQRGSSSAMVGGTYSDPRIDALGDSLSVGISHQLAVGLEQAVSGSTSGQYSLYDENAFIASVTVGHELSDATRLFNTAILENVDLTRNASSSFEPTGLGDGSVHGLSTGVVRDTRDNLSDPHHGAYTVLSVFGSGGPLGGDFSYSKVSAEWRDYVPFHGKTLAVRLWGGSIAGDPPSTDFFYVGGAQTLRGYADNALFGDAFFVANAEVRFPLGKNLKELSGTVFVETGNATEARLLVFQHPLMDGGLGLRLVADSMGLGVVRLDYALGQNGGRASVGVGQSF